MKKRIFSVIIALILVFCATLAYAQQETNKIMDELNKELEQDKVFLPKELKEINKSLRNAMEQGVTKEDLKAILVDLKKKESNVKDTKKTIDIMIDLIKSGVGPKEAGNIVSQAAHLAKAQGLKGKALAAMVHEAIRIRKAEQEKLKQQMKEEKMHQKQHRQEHQNQIQAQEIFQEKEQEKESHGMGHGKGKK
jgi:KaiC/GvpD/RAD55 family RecA-like ATPase